MEVGRRLLRLGAMSATRRPAANNSTRSRPREYLGDVRSRLGAGSGDPRPTEKKSLRGAKGDYGAATLRVPETRAQHCGFPAMGSIVVLIARCSHPLRAAPCLAQVLLDLRVKPFAAYLGRMDSFVLPPDHVQAGPCARWQGERSRGSAGASHSRGGGQLVAPGRGRTLARLCQSVPCRLSTQRIYWMARQGDCTVGIRQQARRPRLAN